MVTIKFIILLGVGLTFSLLVTSSFVAVMARKDGGYDRSIFKRSLEYAFGACAVAYFLLALYQQHP